MPRYSQPVGFCGANPRWLARGMIFATPDGQFDAVSGTSLTRVGTRRQSGKFGVVSGFGATLGLGTTDAITTNVTTNTATRSYVMTYLRHGQGGGNGGRLFEKRTAGSLQHGIFHSSGSLRYQHTWSGSTAAWSLGTDAADVWKCAVMTYDSSLTAVPGWYVNGAAVTTSQITAPVGSASTNTDPYVIGNRGNDSLRVLDGAMGIFAIFDTILTAREATELFLAPWSLFAPVARRVYSFSAAVVPIAYRHYQSQRAA